MVTINEDNSIVIRWLKFNLIAVIDDHLYTLIFADGQAVVAQNEKDLSFMIRTVEVEYRKSGLEISVGKKEYLTTAREAV